MRELSPRPRENLTPARSQGRDARCIRRRGPSAATFSRAPEVSTLRSRSGVRITTSVASLHVPHRVGIVPSHTRLRGGTCSGPRPARETCPWASHDSHLHLVPQSQTDERGNQSLQEAPCAAPETVGVLRGQTSRPARGNGDLDVHSPTRAPRRVSEIPRFSNRRLSSGVCDNAAQRIATRTGSDERLLIFLEAMICLVDSTSRAKRDSSCLRPSHLRFSAMRLAHGGKAGVGNLSPMELERCPFCEKDKKKVPLKSQRLVSCEKLQKARQVVVSSDGARRCSGLGTAEWVLWVRDEDWIIRKK